MQVRFSVPDDVLDGIDKYSGVARSEIMIMALKLIAPLGMPQKERDARFMAALQGRLEVREITHDEIAETAALRKAEIKELARLAQLRQDEYKSRVIAEAAAERELKAQTDTAVVQHTPKPSTSEIAHGTLPDGTMFVELTDETHNEREYRRVREMAADGITYTPNLI